MAELACSNCGNTNDVHVPLVECKPTELENAPRTFFCHGCYAFSHLIDGKLVARPRGGY